MDSEVQQVKERINIAEVVGQYVQLRKAGRNWSGRCPFHNERTPSFMVSPERGTYMCFGCGEKGDVFSFLQKIDGIDFPTALKQLAEKAGVKLSPRTRSPQGEALRKLAGEKEQRLRDICEAAAAYYQTELGTRDDVRNYLKTRGVTEESIQEWRLGYAPATWESLAKHLQSLGFKQDEIVEAGFGVKSEKRPGEIFDRFRGRIMFPIFDASGQPIAVSGRFFERVPGGRDDSAEPAKYVNSPETPLFKKSKTLYGFDKARHAIRRADCILLVEGQFDLVLSHQSGLPFAIALSGTALTPEHLSLMGRLSKRLVLALDADAAGVRSGLKSALMAIQSGFDVKVPTFPAGKDPADLAAENPELLKAAIRTAKTAVEFFLDALKPSAKDARSYHRLVEAQVLPLVASMESAIEREHFVRLVANKLNVSESAVRAELAKASRSAEVSLRNSPDVHEPEPQLGSDPFAHLSPIEKKASMLLFRFAAGSETYARLEGLFGASALESLRERVNPLAEALRFRFDAEVGEHNEEGIAADMLAGIERELARERFKMKFL